MSEIKRPLEGIKVVELATFIAAPCCARFLADLGAEVIKIEAPAGDPLRYRRQRGPSPGPEGEHHLRLGKRQQDLHRPEHQVSRRP